MRVDRVRIVFQSFRLGFLVVVSVLLGVKFTSIVVYDSGLLEVVFREVFLILVLFLVVSKSHAPSENVCGMVSILGGLLDDVCVRSSD